MADEMKGDPWVKEFEDEVYRRFSPSAKHGGCRPPSLSGILQCERPVVRDNRCILHMPKLLIAEKQELNQGEREKEDRLEYDFIQTISKFHIANFESIHFPSVQWNQSPLIEILTRRGTISFNLAVFHQPVNMSGVIFGSHPTFIKTVFRDAANFSVASFPDGAVFSETVFENPAEFRGCSFSGETVFGNLRFLDRADFSFGKIFGKLRFVGGDKNHLFATATNFSRLEIDEKSSITFELASLAEASFLHSDLEKVNFRAVEWCGGRKKWFLGSRRAMLSDENLLESADPNIRDCEAVAENYRQLVLRYEKRRDFEKAEDFHIGEMEVRRLTSSVGAPKLVGALRDAVNPYLLYRILSNYGSSYWQAAFVLLFFAIVASSGFMLLGLRPTESHVGLRPVRYVLAPCFCLPPVSELAADFGHSATHVLSMLTFQREKAFEPATVQAQAWQALSSIFLTGQGALVLLAIRRRFKR